MTATQVSLIEMYTGQRGTFRELLRDLRDEAHAIQEDASHFAEHVDSWLSVHTAETEEKHRYAGDEG